MTVLNIRSAGDLRAFLHTNAAGIAAALIAAASLTGGTAQTITAAVAIVVAITDASLSSVNTADGFRRWFYPVLAAVGGLVVVLGLLTDTQWALWTAIVPLLLGQATANANTDTSPGDGGDLSADAEKRLGYGEVN